MQPTPIRSGCNGSKEAQNLIKEKGSVLGCTAGKGLSRHRTQVIQGNLTRKYCKWICMSTALSLLCQRMWTRRDCCFETSTVFCGAGVFDKCDAVATTLEVALLSMKHGLHWIF